MRKHRKQFLISQKRYLREDFKYFELEKELILSYQKDLKVEVIETIFGKAYLLGLAFQVKKDRLSPKKELEKISKESEILEVLSTWSGRYIVIINKKLYMDFGGMLGCFYGTDREKNIYLSSSLALIKEVTNFKEIEHEEIKEQEAMDWYPGPLTILENTYRLLPSEILEIPSLKKIFKNYKLDFSNLSMTNIKLEFIENFSNLLKNIVKEADSKILLPLTGGRDSRTILSFLLKNNINFSSFIMEGKTKLEAFDLNIGKEIAQKYGFNHKIIKKESKEKKYSNKLERIFLEHSMKQSVNGGREFIKDNLYEALPADALLLRGGVFEGTLKHYFPLKNNIELEERLINILEFFNLLKIKDNFRIKSLEFWLKNIEQNTIEVDWQQRFYIEQRVGCWLSSVEQAEDLKEANTIHPMNSSYLVSLLWALPKEYLDKNRMGQIEIIKEIKPELLKFPFNKRTKKEIIKRGLQIFKEEGINILLKKGYQKFVRKN